MMKILKNNRIGSKETRVGRVTLKDIMEREKKKRKMVQERHKQWKKDKKVAKSRAKKIN